MHRFAPAAPPFVRPIVPQRQNGADCGPFLLQFARRFFFLARKHAPPQVSQSDSVGWFAAAEAGAIKGDHIHREYSRMPGWWRILCRSHACKHPANATRVGSSARAPHGPEGAASGCAPSMPRRPHHQRWALLL